MNWYMQAFKKYAIFDGRSRRKEYWTFTLTNIVITIVLGFIDRSTGLILGDGGNGVLETLFSLVVLVPGIAAMIRRLHDTGRTGWWFLLAFIPIIGWIVLIVFACQDSQAGDNQYGPNPKQDEAPAPGMA